MPVRQQPLHGPFLGDDRGRKSALTHISILPCHAAGNHLPIQMGAEVYCVLGQPVHPTLCLERLSRAAARHASRYRERGTTGLGGKVAQNLPRPTREFNVILTVENLRPVDPDPVHTGRTTDRARSTAR